MIKGKDEPAAVVGDGAAVGVDVGLFVGVGVDVGLFVGVDVAVGRVVGVAVGLCVGAGVFVIPGLTVGVAAVVWVVDAGSVSGDVSSNDVSEPDVPADCVIVGSGVGAVASVTGCVVVGSSVSAGSSEEGGIEGIVTAVGTN